MEGAELHLAQTKSDYDFVIAHGPDDAHEHGASHYRSRGPYYAQFIAEGRALEPTSRKPPSQDRKPTGLAYWFSGTNFSDTGVSACWGKYNHGTCRYRDTKIDPLDSVLND